MGTLFDIIAALHPDMGAYVYTVGYDPISREPSRERREELAHFGPRRDCEKEWISAFIRFQEFFRTVPATVRLIEIDPEKENTLAIHIELGSDCLNRADADPDRASAFS